MIHIFSEARHMDRNRATAESTLRRLRWLLRLRPQSLAAPLSELLSPPNRRLIIEHQGLKLFLDPLSHLGMSIIDAGDYGADVIDVFRRELKPGDTCLDIGANEGLFSALAAQLIGAEGVLIAVEPQSRLLDVLSINIALNAATGGTGRQIVLHRAVGMEDGQLLTISLTPLSNTGAISIVNRYRWSHRTETVEVMSGLTILETAGVDRIDFVKIDVEGYEPEVVAALAPLLRQKKIRTLFLDYHNSILQQRGIDPEGIHASILGYGYRADPARSGLQGFALYRSE